MGTGKKNNELKGLSHEIDFKKILTKIYRNGLNKGRQVFEIFWGSDDFGMQKVYL
jgi:hypothetical protein